MKKSEYSGIENCNPSQWLLQPTVLHPVFWHGYSKALDITHKIPNAVCLCARCTPSQWNAVYLYYTPRRFIAIYKVAIGSRTKDLPEKTDNLIYYTWPLQRAVAFHSITNSHFSKDSWEEMTQRVIVSLSIWIPLCHHLQGEGGSCKLHPCRTLRAQHEWPPLLPVLPMSPGAQIVT